MHNCVFLCALGVGAVHSVIRRALDEDVVRRESLDESEALRESVDASVAKGVCGNRQNVPVNIRDADESTYTHIPNIPVADRRRDGDPLTRFVGQGYCTVAGGAKVSADKSGWTTVGDVEEDGSSQECADTCEKIAGCEGYITKDRKECVIFKTRAHGADEDAAFSCFSVLQGWAEMHTSGRKGAPPASKEKLRAKDLSRLIERYEEKAATLISHIRASEGKTDKKGTKRGLMGKMALGMKGALGGSTDNSKAHLHSTDVQQVLSRMRGFEKCRGMTRDLEHIDEETTVKWRKATHTAKELAAQYKKLLTEGDDCCSDDCDITTMEMNHETDTRTCEPCKASCQKGDDGLPSMLYKGGYYEDGNIDGPLKENYMDGEDIRSTIAFTGVGRSCETMTSELQEDKSPDLSFCYNDAKKCPDGVCRGIKSLARYAARTLQTTIAYDVCPPSQSRDDNPETKRKDPAYQICGPFLPNYKGCSLNLEHILMRGNADEIWDADYAMEKAFGGPACLEHNGVEWFPRWLSHFTEAKKQTDRSQKAKDVVQFFVPYAYAEKGLSPPNDNSDGN